MKNNIFAPVSPCKGCNSRHPECHAGCEAYKQFAKENEQRREARYNYLRPYRQLIDIREELRLKYKK